MSSYPDNRSGQSAAIFRLLTRQRGSTPEDPKEFRNPSKGELRQRMGGTYGAGYPFIRAENGDREADSLCSRETGWKTFL